MIKFLKIIFTWWNGQTIGTFLNTLFFGKLVGIDDSKNKYYGVLSQLSPTIHNVEQTLF